MRYILVDIPVTDVVSDGEEAENYINKIITTKMATTK